MNMLPRVIGNIPNIPIIEQSSSRKGSEDREYITTNLRSRVRVRRPSDISCIQFECSSWDAIACTNSQHTIKRVK